MEYRNTAFILLVAPRVAYMTVPDIAATSNYRTAGTMRRSPRLGPFTGMLGHGISKPAKLHPSKPSHTSQRITNSFPERTHALHVSGNPFDLRLASLRIYICWSPSALHAKTANRENARHSCNSPENGFARSRTRKLFAILISGAKVRGRKLLLQAPHRFLSPSPLCCLQR